MRHYRHRVTVRKNSHYRNLLLALLAWRKLQGLPVMPPRFYTDADLRNDFASLLDQVVFFETTLN